MPARIQLRPLTTEERTKLEQIQRSQTRPHREVERARILLLAAEGMAPTEIANQVGRSVATIYQRLHRYNQVGLVALDDQARQGRPRLYSEHERGQMIAVARTHPDKLGLPFGHWSLNRLVTYLGEKCHLTISRAQLARILEAEGLRWYQEKVYFTERPDPQFAEKRGP